MSRPTASESRWATWSSVSASGPVRCRTPADAVSSRRTRAPTAASRCRARARRAPRSPSSACSRWARGARTNLPSRCSAASGACGHARRAGSSPHWWRGGPTGRASRSRPGRRRGRSRRSRGHRAESRLVTSRDRRPGHPGPEISCCPEPGSRRPPARARQGVRRGAEGAAADVGTSRDFAGSVLDHG